MVGEMLEQVSLSAWYARRYPDQCSGGERQRVAIARALISRPSILICDEVTSALDVSVQAAIVELLGSCSASSGLSMVFVTHNLPLVRSIAQKVAVLADGSIVEYGETAEHAGQPAAAVHAAADRQHPVARDGDRRGPSETLEQTADAGPAERRGSPRDRFRPARHPARDRGPATSAALPFHGNDVTQAPAMAALAEGGVVFDNAYTASPLCAPARAR